MTLLLPSRSLIVRRSDVARELRRLGFKLYDDDALRAWILPGLGAPALAFADAAFEAVTYDLDSGSSGLTIPTGATGYEVWVVGGGGGGGQGPGGPSSGAGGGGAGRAYRSGVVLPGEWGASLSRTAGAGGDGDVGGNTATNGGNSTLTGTLGGVAISMTGNGGGGTNSNTGGTAGSASGGSSNLSGSAGANNAGGGQGGAAGEYVGTGERGRGGHGGAFTGTGGEAGVGGRVRVRFT